MAVVLQNAGSMMLLLWCVEAALVLMEGVVGDGSELLERSVLNEGARCRLQDSRSTKRFEWTFPPPLPCCCRQTRRSVVVCDD